MITVSRSCNGAARIGGTTIAVWLLVYYRRFLGLADMDILKVFDNITQTDLHDAWEYYTNNMQEIDDILETRCNSYYDIDPSLQENNKICR